MSCHPRRHPLLLLALLALCRSAATKNVDAERLGTVQATLPLAYKNGRTIVHVELGTPPQAVNLTFYIGFLTVVGGCGSCVKDAPKYVAFGSDADNSYYIAASTSAYGQENSTFSLTTATRYSGNDSHMLTLTGSLASDVVRGDGRRLIPGMGSEWGIRIASSVVDGTGQPTNLGAGVSGFWGLGVDSDDAAGSLLPSATLPNSSFSVGFDLSNTTSAAGEMHWGGVPLEAFVGRVNWIPTSCPSWAVDIGSFQAGSTKIATGDPSFGILDPGIDAIYVPTSLAEPFFTAIDGAARDKVYTERWNLPCDADPRVQIWIGGTPYTLASRSLIIPRDRGGRTCWANIVAWANGSKPEAAGEIRLGAAFLSGVYMALHYSSEARYVGLAGKPASVNAHGLYPLPKYNPHVVAIALGILFPLLALLLGLCFLKNRYSLRGILQRIAYDHTLAAEAVANAHMDAAIGASLNRRPGPPPLFPPPFPVPPGIPRPPFPPPPGAFVSPHLQQPIYPTQVQYRDTPSSAPASPGR